MSLFKSATSRLTQIRSTVSRARSRAGEVRPFKRSIAELCSDNRVRIAAVACLVAIASGSFAAWGNRENDPHFSLATARSRAGGTGALARSSLEQVAESAAKTTLKAINTTKKRSDKARPAPTTAPTTTSTTVATTVPPTTTTTTAPPPTLVDYGEPLGAAVDDTGVEPWPAGCCAPLTGMGFDDPSYASRNPIAVKVSNSPSADPQTGLIRADMIYEIKVEGFTRLIAVYQSRGVGDVGPIRSGRTSDPPLLHALGQPMVSNSGGNAFVLKTFEQAETNGWLVNLPRGGPAYFRSTDRSSPHNFYTQPDWFWANAASGQPAQPQFAFLAAGESNAAAASVNQATVTINRVTSSFTWDPTTAMFLRDQYGRTHSDKPTGKRVARASVVVLATPYGISGADVRSPEAITTWSGGEAWVFTGGTYIHGRWARGDANETFQIVDDAERPIKLYAGPIWVTLTDSAPTIS